MLHTAYLLVPFTGLVYSSALSACNNIMPPDAPYGCPYANAPPKILYLSIASEYFLANNSSITANASLHSKNNMNYH